MEKALLLAEAISKKCFDGNLPEFGAESAWIAAALQVFASDAPEEVREMFGSQLTDAIRALRCVRDTKWLN